MSLTDLLAHNARVHPHRPALTDGLHSFDYRTLDMVASQVAGHLRELGVGRGDRVALLGPRDARLCALLHGVLRSGAAAVMADPEWSGPDLHRRLDAVQVSCALTTDAAVRAPEAYRTEVLDVDALAAGSPAGQPLTVLGPDTDLAYLSFTSGSSGAPKAVAVTHANAVHYARSLRHRLGLTDADAPRIAHVTTLAADLGHTSWLLALATAGSVHVVPDHEVRDPEAFWASLRSAGVSVLKTTPSHLMALLEGRPSASPALHTVLLGGEALPRTFAAGLLDGGVTARVANHYGPTETTVGATCFLASAPSDLPADEATVPIGTAIGEVDLRLLDGTGEPVPDGAEGELFIGGKGVSAGYFGRPDETARRFTRHDGEGVPPAGGWGRVYRTGDVCRRRPDGNLVFLGRSDRQVKVRGFRVDLAEVERAMEEFPGIVKSAVIVRDTPTGSQLLAAVRSADGHGERVTVDALHSHLRDRLPGYSVPQPIIAVQDFPIGSNGKLDRERLGAVVSGIIEARARRAKTGQAAPSDRIDTELVRSIADLWAGALGLPFVGPHADVLSLGGDSILAMRTVALLRRSGYRVAFEDFYQNPTPTLLASVATPVHDGASVSAAAPDGGRDRRLAPAQRWLFRQPVDDLRHWNQSVVLRCEAAVDAAALSAAVEGVLQRHPALRQPLSPDGPGDPRPVGDLDVVSFSSIPRPAGRLAEVIDGVCTELHRSLDPAAGRLIRIHLFTGPPGVDDRLAVIVHHLAIDGLSWRILLDDFARAYRAALSGQQADLPPTADFYRWAAASPSASTVAGTDAPRLPVTGVTSVTGGTEPAAISWALDEGATARLVGRYGRGQGLEAFLLSAFADAVSGWSGQSRLAVEVETHGRDVSGDDGEYLDTVGWFTAVKWVTVDSPDRTGSVDSAGRPAVAERVREVGRRVGEATELPMDTAGSRPEVGFNFLGTFRLPDEPSLGWSVADEQAGTARCTAGDPLYLLRLTARIVEDRLVTDLVYTWPKLSHGSADGIVASFARSVAAAVEAPALPHTRTPASTSGQLLHPGTGTRPGGGRWRVSEPTRVLLTGATGYLGRHLLTEFVDRGAHVTCLVRGERDADAARRLDTGRDRVDVVAGDIDREGLGLSRAGLARARAAHVVVHAAADVRLVASPAELEQTNHAAVQRLLGWIDAQAPQARFHHVSTLAVAGSVDGPARRFSEADLRIGQSFRTPYERAKFGAEESVRSWAASGRQYYIHRSGHIAAHSRTGAFQRNIGDNRIYQLVRGYVLAGAAPRRPSTTFAFSHVDTVAAGIAAIATNPHAAPGVYHVETPYEVPHDELVGWLVDYGYQIVLTDDDTFARAMARAEQTHPRAARLASAWSQLEDRNVVVDSSYTTSVLGRVGVRFAPPTPQWWSAALSWAAGVGFLPSPVVSGRTA
ncbi:amino acid adenylation domain-containing protein [Kitasatospora sp. GP82]|uniref:amino acid adenylation domain-containing protein n=1 Tax=Kitasatospora sp. GP82 TaxID=3035089 RepID=UPI002475EDE2|nr:amino acid adenylation domain-containing protein [Kitasatospora sp. GP82]